MGTGIQDDASGRAAITALELQEPQLRPEGKEFFFPCPPAVDHRCFGLLQRDGLHPNKEGRGGSSEGQPLPGQSSSSRPKEERKISKGKGCFCKSRGPHQLSRRPQGLGAPCTLLGGPLPTSSMSERETALHGRGRQGRGKERGGPLAAGNEDVDYDYETPVSVVSDYDGMPFEGDGSMPGCDRWRKLSSTPPLEALNKDEASQEDAVSMEQLDAKSGKIGSAESLLCPTPFVAWVHQCIRQVLSSRTRFSYFIMRTISASRNGRDDSIATALFPIPTPFEDAFRIGPELRSQKKRRKLALRKLMHLIVMTLNYEHSRSLMAILALLRRRPGPMHKRVFQRIRTFCEASGPPSFLSMSGGGRKRFQD